jgi:hypothetical protein
MMANKYGYDATTESSHRNIVTPAIFRTPSVADVPLAPQLDYASPLKAQGILLFLDEVERALIFDGF